MRGEEDCCTLELYVFEEDEAHRWSFALQGGLCQVNMYLHHEISLGAYPLCVEWISRSSSNEGSYAAVGSIDHSIEPPVGRETHQTIWLCTLYSQSKYTQKETKYNIYSQSFNETKCFR